MPHIFEACYVSGAVAPPTGDRVFLERPCLKADTFQLFVAAFAQACPDSLTILLLGNSGAHTAQRSRWPAPVRDGWRPPYCPELNPIERLWRDLKDDWAWPQFPALAAHQAYVGDVLQAYEAPTRRSLTGSAYVVEAMHALCS